VDYFYNRMVEILGDGDPETLGEYPIPLRFCGARLLATQSNPAKRFVTWSQNSAPLARLICAATLGVVCLWGSSWQPPRHSQTPAKLRPHPAVKLPRNIRPPSLPAPRRPQLEQWRAPCMKNPPTLYMPSSRSSPRETPRPIREPARPLPSATTITTQSLCGGAQVAGKGRGGPSACRVRALLAGGNRRSDGAYETALDEFGQFRSRYPSSVMTESAVKPSPRPPFLPTGLSGRRRLDGYPGTTNKAALVYLRAQAREKVAVARGDNPLPPHRLSGRREPFPVGEEAKFAVAKIPALQDALGDQFPGTPLTTEIARARLSMMRAAGRTSGRLPRADAQTSGAARERAVLRLAQADAQTTAGAAALSSLEL